LIGNGRIACYQRRSTPVTKASFSRSGASCRQSCPTHLESYISNWSRCDGGARESTGASRNSSWGRSDVSSWEWRGFACSPSPVRVAASCSECRPRCSNAAPGPTSVARVGASELFRLNPRGDGFCPAMLHRMWAVGWDPVAAAAAVQPAPSCVTRCWTPCSRWSRTRC
jgi:hypothetical protein